MDFLAKGVAASKPAGFGDGGEKAIPNPFDFAQGSASLEAATRITVIANSLDIGSTDD